MTSCETKGIAQLDKLRAEISERFAEQHAARLAREEQTPQPDDQEDVDLGVTGSCKCGAEIDEDGNCPVCDPWEEDSWDDDFLSIVGKTK